MFKVTFTNKGFIVAVIYIRASTAESAREIAAMSVCGKYDSVRAERVEG